jgi:hypothetical protein
MVGSFEPAADFYIAFVGKPSFSEYSGIVLLIDPAGRQSTNGAIKMEAKNLKLLWARLPDAGALSRRVTEADMLNRVRCGYA